MARKSYTVLHDSFGYRTVGGHTQYARRGETVELDPKQAERALDLGAVASQSDDPDTAADAVADSEGQLTADQVHSMGVRAIRKLVGDDPQLAAQVVAFERERPESDQRDSVLALAPDEAPSGDDSDDSDGADGS